MVNATELALRKKAQEFDEKMPPITTLAARLGKTIATTPKYACGCSMWVFGIVVMLLLAAPYAPTNKEERKYRRFMNKAELVEGMVEAEARMAEANARVYNAKVWFWRFRSEHRRNVERAMGRQEAVRAELKGKYDERDALITKGKEQVGIWSSYGFKETRDLFWSCWESGKAFAKRMTFYDVLFGAMGRGRDEHVLATILKIVFQMIMNFTLGLCGALVGFTYYLWGVVETYNGELWSSGAFFLLFLLAGVSVVAAFLSAMVGLAGGSVYMMARTAMKNKALQDERRRVYLQNNPAAARGQANPRRGYGGGGGYGRAQQPQGFRQRPAAAQAPRRQNRFEEQD